MTPPADKSAPASAPHGADDASASADPEPPQWLATDLVVEDAAWNSIADAEALVKRAAAALAAHSDFVDEAPAVACLSLSTDAAVHALNRTHRGKDKPTNVLSFPTSADHPADETGRVFLGDVIIAAETVFAEAREQDISPEHHLQHLVIHGLLHLLGFDHETDEEAHDMESLETEILADLGIGDPYADDR